MTSSGPPLADAHGPQGAVAGVAVRGEDHAAAAGHGFPDVLVDDGLVGRHEDAAVFAGGGEAEQVVILVDRSADGAEAVVAVGEGVGDGKRLEPAGPGRQDDPDVGDVVGRHRVKPDLQVLRVSREVVGGEYPVGHGGGPGRFPVDPFPGDRFQTCLPEPPVDLLRVPAVGILLDHAAPEYKTALAG